MNKFLAIEQALSKIEDGMTLMVGGFLGVGSPQRLIDAIAQSGKKDFTLICNDTAYPDKGVGILIAQKQVRRVITSHIGTNSATIDQMNAGALEVQFVPQGTLAERIRSGGSGLGGFLTPTGLGTQMAEGKQVMHIDGRDYLLELPLKADLALIRASIGDTQGNLIFRGTAQNFNPLMATAAELVMAEIGALVEAGTLAPEAIHTPGIFVDYILR